jgi:hypothetical protein
VVLGHGPPRLGRERLGLLDTDTELLGRDERGDPPVAQPAGASHGGLAVAADPQLERLLNRPRQHRDAVEPPELARKRDLVLGPAPAHDRDRLVGAAAALAERHASGQELAFLLGADAEGRQ